MARTVARLQPILPYGLDIPFTQFGAGSHANYKFRYLSERNGASMKFFEQPIYTHLHAVVRVTKDQYGKITFSVNPDEADFIRQVERDVSSNLDRIIDMAEPTLNILAVPPKSMTYENLVKVRLNKTVGQGLDGKLIPDGEHEVVLEKGVKVLMTLEIHGYYHSANGKGVLSRIHCYQVVETF